MPIDDGKWRNNIELIDFGFIQDGTEVGGGFLIKNVSNQILVNSQYYITIYDADAVTLTSSGLARRWAILQVRFSSLSSQSHPRLM